MRARQEKKQSLTPPQESHGKVAVTVKMRALPTWLIALCLLSLSSCSLIGIRKPTESSQTLIVEKPLEIDCGMESMTECPPIEITPHKNGADVWGSRGDLRGAWTLCAVRHAALLNCIKDHNRRAKEKKNGS